MTLKSVFRPFSDAAAIEGTAPDRQRNEHERKVRQARLDYARRQTSWTYIPQPRLVRRGRYLIDSETDAVFVVRRGHVFEPRGSNVGYVPAGTPMTYTVDQGGDVLFIEPSGGGHTWTEICERRARAGTPA